MNKVEALRKPIVVGIVGGIASGKSEVTRLLGEKNGTIISADAIAHRVLLEPDVIEALVELFGEQILRIGSTSQEPTRTIDRAKLGALVFGDGDDKRAQRRQLEAIVHPRIRHVARTELEQLKREAKVKLIVLDAPLLIEGGWLLYCDRVVMVDSPAPLREKRAMERGWTKKQWMDREAAQMSLEEKRRHATDTLVNEGTIEQLKKQIDDLFDI